MPIEKRKFFKFKKFINNFVDRYYDNLLFSMFSRNEIHDDEKSIESHYQGPTLVKTLITLNMNIYTSHINFCLYT